MKKIICIAVWSALVSACGGGGGSSGASVPEETSVERSQPEPIEGPTPDSVSPVDPPPTQDAPVLKPRDIVLSWNGPSVRVDGTCIGFVIDQYRVEYTDQKGARSSEMLQLGDLQAVEPGTYDQCGYQIEYRYTVQSLTSGSWNAAIYAIDQDGLESVASNPVSFIVPSLELSGP